MKHLKTACQKTVSA